MSRVLMIGAGGVATVAAFKIVQNQDVFTEFMIASRRKEKCDKLVKDIHAKGYKMDIQTAEVDADDVEQLKALFNSYKPELVINLALPYQDLTIMDACLACGCNYMDTAPSAWRFTISCEGDVIQRLVVVVALFQNLLQSFSYLLAGRALLLRTEVGVESAFAINAVE